MAKKKLSTSTIAIAVVGGFAVLVAVDHYVLKGKLGISGRINQLIGKLRESLGQGSGPITAPPPSEEMPSTEELSGVLEGLSTEGEGEGGMEEEEYAEEPEAAMRARAFTARARRRRRGYSGRTVRLGGFHP